MVRSSFRLKALGVFILGLMAVWVVTAQAEETGGSWTYINPSTGVLKTFEGALGEPSIAGELAAGTTIALDAKVQGGTLIKYECKAVEVVEGKLQPEGKISFRLAFHQCEAFLAGVLSKNCSPSKETVTTSKVKGQMLLNKLAGGTVDKVLIAESAEASKDFAFIESTEACSLGEKVLIGGKLAIQDPAPTTHSVRHTIKEFPDLTHLFIISDTVEHKATLAGSFELFLTGEHLNYKWAGLWN